MNIIEYLNNNSGLITVIATIGMFLATSLMVIFNKQLKDETARANKESEKSWTYLELKKMNDEVRELYYDLKELQFRINRQHFFMSDGSIDKANRAGFLEKDLLFIEPYFNKCNRTVKSLMRNRLIERTNASKGLLDAFDNALTNMTIAMNKSDSISKLPDISSIQKVFEDVNKELVVLIKKMESDIDINNNRLKEILLDKIGETVGNK